MAILKNEGCSSKPAQFQIKPKESDMKQKKKRKPLCFSLRKDGKSPLAEIERGLRERLLWGSFHSQIRLTRGHKCKIITILTRGHNNLNKRAQVQNNYGKKKVLHQIVNVYIFLLSFQHQSLLLLCRFTGHMIFSNLDSCRVV